MVEKKKVKPVRVESSVNPKIEQFVKTLLKDRKEDNSIFNLESFGTVINLEPIGIPTLDFTVLGGGLAEGRTYELFGHESSGKSTLALQIAANRQRVYPDKDVIFIDSEHALDMVYAKKLGLDLARVWVSQPDYGEQALSVAQDLMRSGYFSLMVADSVAALTPKAIVDGDIGDTTVAVQARLMSQALKTLVPIANQSKVTMLFTNQMRSKIGVRFGPTETTPGGNALKYYASVRLQLTTIGKIKDSAGNVIGNTVQVRAVKNKLFPPFRETELKLYYGSGFSRESSLVDMAVALNIVVKDGARYEYGGQSYKGEGALVTACRESTELCEELMDGVKREVVAESQKENKTEQEENEK